MHATTRIIYNISIYSEILNTEACIADDSEECIVYELTT